MNDLEFLSDYYKKCADFLLSTDVTENIIAAKKMILATKSNGNKLIFAGNGASASIANHASLDFTKQGKIKSVNFNESALITAFSNDYGYEHWVNAARYANKNGINVITFSGFSPDNPMKMSGDINFWLDSKAYNIIEGIHQIWLMSVCDLIIGKQEYSVT